MMLVGGRLCGQLPSLTTSRFMFGGLVSRPFVPILTLNIGVFLSRLSAPVVPELLKTQQMLFGHVLLSKRFGKPLPFGTLSKAFHGVLSDLSVHS